MFSVYTPMAPSIILRHLLSPRSILVHPMPSIIIPFYSMPPCIIPSLSHLASSHWRL